jgi:hypothetical protein
MCGMIDRHTAAPSHYEDDFQDTLKVPRMVKKITGLKRRGLQPRLASSDCLLRRLDKAYNAASRMVKIIKWVGKANLPKASLFS